MIAMIEAADRGGSVANASPDLAELGPDNVIVVEFADQRDERRDRRV